MKQTTKLNINMNNKSKPTSTNQVMIFDTFIYEDVPFYLRYNDENLLDTAQGAFKAFVTTVLVLYTSTDLKKLIGEMQVKPYINIIESIILLFYLETENRDTSNNLAEMQKSSILLQQYISLIYLFKVPYDAEFSKSLLNPYLKMPLEKATWKRIENNSITVCKDFFKKQLCRLHWDISTYETEATDKFNEWFTITDKNLVENLVKLQVYKVPKGVNFNQMFYLFVHNIGFTESIKSYENGKYVCLIKHELEELFIWFRFIEVVGRYIMAGNSKKSRSDLLEYKKIIGSYEVNIDKDIFNKKTYNNLRILFQEVKYHYIFSFTRGFAHVIVQLLSKKKDTNLKSLTLQLLPISDLVKNNPILAFLNDSINVIESIKTKLVTQKVLVQKENLSHEDNFVQINNSSSIYTSLEEWNKIYHDLVLTEDIDDHIQKKTFKIGAIMYEIAKEFSTNIPSRLKIFEQLIKDNPKFIVQIIQTSLQKITYSLVRRGNQQGKEFSLGLTFLSSILGETIFKHLFDHSRKFFNQILTISDSNHSNITTLLISILTNDDQLTQKIYNDFNITHNGTKVMLKLINNFLLKHFIQLYIKNELPNTLQERLDRYWKHYQRMNSLNKINKELTADYIQIGYDIIDLLEKQNIVSRYTSQNQEKMQHMVKFEPELVAHFSENLHLFRPFLVQNNLNFVKQNAKDSSTYQLIYDIYNNFIHINPDMELSLSSDCYLRTHRPHIKLTIDNDYYQFFLRHYISLMSQTHINISNSDSFEDILNIYNISSDDLKKIYNEVDSKDQTILDNLFQFAVDFNINMNKDLEKSLKTVSQQYVGRIKNIYNKIYSNKLFFVGLLKEVCIYSIFGYFIANGFLDTRGRYYLEGYHFNIQNFPLAKAFIKPFSFCNKVNIYRHYPDIQKAFIENLKTEKLKEVVKNMSLDTFSFKLREDEISYLYKFFNSSQVSRKDFISVLMTPHQNSNDLLSFIRQNKKKDEYTFLIESYIYQYINQSNKPFISNYYELDASASGLQMTSILLNDTNIGKKCNLLGAEKVDIYSTAGNGFKKQVLALTKVVEALRSFLHLPHYIKETPTIMDEIEYKKLEGAVVQEKLNALLYLNWEKSYRLSELMRDILQDSKVQEFIKDYFSNKHEWILDTFANEIMTYTLLQDIDKNHLKFFISICKGIWFFKNLDDYLWIYQQNLLFDRALFKKAIMTYGYNSTCRGRIEDFVEFFTEHASSHQRIDKSKLNKIATVVEHYFKFFRSKELPECEIPKEISKLVAQEKKPITITNKFFNIIINPCKSKESTVNICREDLRLQLSIEYKTNETDSNSIRTGFIPNFIHSMDAFIVHLLYEKIYHINEYFRINKINFSIPLTTTHDTFMMLITPFLPLIIEDCYKELILYNYIETLKPNSELFLKLIKKYFDSPNKRKEYLSQMENFNPYFIK